MFKKDLTPGSRSKVKSSVQRALRNQFVETHPGFEPYIDEVLPKKASLEAVKLYVSLIAFLAQIWGGSNKYINSLNPFLSPDRAVLYVVDSKPIFFQTAHSPLLPHLRILHEFPNALPTIGIDRGAIRFVLSGATLMAPGLTSPGGRLPDPLNNPEDKPLQAGAIVGITAEGKQEICMVGELKMGTEEMKAKNKGAVIDEGHYLGDGLWKLAFD
ncbi:translation machinery-associated protein 20 [Myotisia sp. PD_48]|nr:translation machinery-associated protein 20 [Myotisia sp. PD_48]